MQNTLEGSRKRLAEQLFDMSAIKFGAFRMKLHEKNPDAPLSPIYVDLRLLRSFPQAMKSAIEVYLELVNNLKFEVMADVPTAATPIVAILSYQLNCPMISPRRDQKAHGLSKKIDGSFKSGQTVLLVDDLITQADSKLETISALESNGLVVKDIVVLVDREQGGPGQLQAAGYNFYCGVKLSELLKFYLETNRIDKNQYERTVNYLKGDVK